MMIYIVSLYTTILCIRYLNIFQIQKHIINSEIVSSMYLSRITNVIAAVILSVQKLPTSLYY